MAPITGHSCKLYYNSATVAVPTWVEIAGVGDVSVPQLQRMMATLQSRDSDYTAVIKSLIDQINVNARVIHGIDTTVYGVLRAAFLAGTVLTQIAVMNGAIATSGNEGLTMPAYVSEFPFDQPLTEIMGHDVVFTGPAYFEESSAQVEPAWLVVA